MIMSSKRLRAGLLAMLATVAVAAGAVQQEVVASRLDHPWAVAFLPEGRFLVTERGGRMRVVEADGRLGAPLGGVPQVVARGQGGLLDVVLDSGFASNRTIYFCYAEPGEGGNSTAMARARLAADRARLEEVKVIFRQQPKVDSSYHFGCRIVEHPDGTLYLGLGERNSRREDSQRLANHIGKMVRVTKDGAVPPDNPFVGRNGAAPEVWSYGHRNIQGATLGPDGRVWTHEHGPQGGDEVNVPQPGRNYGWPVVTHGEQYGGGKMGEGTQKAGMEQPLHHWVPSIAPSGMAFLTSDRYGPDLKGNLFVGSLKFRYVARLELANGKVARETKWADIDARVRDVRQGPDGLLYVLTDEGNGKLIRLKP